MKNNPEFLFHLLNTKTKNGTVKTTKENYGIIPLTVAGSWGFLLPFTLVHNAMNTTKLSHISFTHKF